MTAASTGAVYDRGYRPYDGPRLGQRGARQALFWASVRRALGIRRSWRQKAFPWLLLVITTIPAIVNVGVGYLTRDSPLEDFEFITYRQYVGVSTALLLFVAFVAPDIVCPDRQYRMLSLIFSRPLTGLDYVGAKVLAITVIVFGFGFIPHVILFVGQLFVADGALDYARDNADVIWKAPASVAVLAVYLSVIGITISSYTIRRVVASTVFLGGLLVTSSVSAIIQGDPATRDPSAIELLNILTVPLKLRDVIFLGRLSDDTSLSGVDNGALMALGVYVGVLTLCGYLLYRRYRHIDA